MTMYMPYTVKKDDQGKEYLFYHGLKKDKDSAIKLVSQRKGFVKDYNTKQVVFENML